MVYEIEYKMYLFMDYLTTLLVTHTIRRRMIRQLTFKTEDNLNNI